MGHALGPRTSGGGYQHFGNHQPTKELRPRSSGLHGSQRALVSLSVMTVLMWTSDLGCRVLSMIGADFVQTRMCYAAVGREIFALAIWGALILVAVVVLSRPVSR